MSVFSKQGPVEGGLDLGRQTVCMVRHENHRGARADFSVEIKVVIGASKTARGFAITVTPDDLDGLIEDLERGREWLKNPEVGT